MYICVSTKYKERGEEWSSNNNNNNEYQREIISKRDIVRIVSK